MPEGENKLISRKGALVDLVLSGLWFAFFAVALRDYVPSYQEPFVTFFAVSTAGCMTGIFWLAISMFRVVLVDERRKERE